MALDDAIGNDQLPDFSGDDVLDRVARSMNIPEGANGDMILNRLNRKLKAPVEDEKEKVAKAAKPAKPDLSKYGTPVDQLPDLSAYGTPVGEQVPIPEPRPAEAPQPPSLGITGNIVAGAKGVPAGAAQSVGGILKGGAALYQGGVPASPEQPQYDIMGNPTGQTVAPTEAIPAQPLQERGLYKAGQAVENAAPTMSPAEQDSWLGRFGTMAGGIAPYAAATLVNPTIGLAAGFTGMAADTYGKVYEEAKAKGADEETATKAASRSALVAGVLGSLPLGAGKYAESLAAKVVSSSAAFATAGEAQEAILQEIAKDYDPKAGYTLDQKRLIAELILGAGMGGLHHAFRERPEAANQQRPGTGAPPPAALAPPGAQARGPQPGPEAEPPPGPQPGGPGPQPGGPGAGPSVFTGRTRYDAGNGWWERERNDGRWEQFVPPGGGGPPPGGAGAGAQSGGGPGPQPNQGGPGAQARPGATGTQEQASAPEAEFKPDLSMDPRTRAKMERVYRMFDPKADVSKMSDADLAKAVWEHTRDTSATGYTSRDTAQEKAARETHQAETNLDKEQRDYLKAAGIPEADVNVYTRDQLRQKYTEVSDIRTKAEEKAKAEAADRLKTKRAQVQEVLRNAGFSDEEIKAMPVEERKRRYQEATASGRTDKTDKTTPEQPAYESGTGEANRENQTAQKNEQSDIPQGTREQPKRSVREQEAERQRTAQEQKKRETLLRDPDALRAYAADKGISEKEMRDLLQSNYDTNAPHLKGLDEFLASDEAKAQGAAERERASKIKFTDLSGTREEPIRPTKADDVAAATPAEPTPAQAEAENYRHAHMELPQFGLKGKNSVSIETGVGQERKGVDRNGKPWSVTLEHGAYGRIKGTQGADGQPLDVFVGPHPTSPHAFIIDQHDPETGQFDEHKIMLGYRTPIDAMHAYANSYADGGKDRIGHVTAMGPDEFKTWLQGDTTRPSKTHVSTPLAPAATEIPPGSEGARARSPLTEVSAEAGTEETPKAAPGGEIDARGSLTSNSVPSDQPGVSSRKNAESSSQNSVAPQNSESAEGQGQKRHAEGDNGANSEQKFEHGAPSSVEGAEEQDHTRLIEKALGSDADLVAPVDIARASEIMNELPGIDMAAAFGRAVVERAVKQKFLTALEAAKAYGPEVNDVLEPGREGASGGRTLAKPESAAPRQERTSHSKEAGELPSRGETGKAEGAERRAPAANERAAPVKAAEPGATSGKPAARAEASNAAEHKPAAKAPNNAKLAVKPKPEPAAPKEPVTEKGPDKLPTFYGNKTFPKNGRTVREVDRQIDDWLADHGAVKREAEITKDVTLPSGAALPNRKLRKTVYDLPDGRTVEKESGTASSNPASPRAESAKLIEVSPEWQKPAASPTTEKGADNKEQLVIPGAEKAGQGDLAQRAANAPLKPKAAQKSMDVGLFGDESKQTDLMDMLGKKPSLEQKAHRDQLSLLDYTAPVDTGKGGGLGRLAQAHVLALGRETKTEHLIAYDANGDKVDNGNMEGSAFSIAIDPKFLDRLHDPDEAIVIHHNHPTDTNTSFSAADLAVATLPGAHAVWAHAHNGDIYRIEVTPRAKAIAPKQWRDRAVWVNNIVVRIKGEILPVLNAAYGAGRIDMVQADRLWGHLVQVVLRDAGFSKYSDNVDDEDFRASVPGLNDKLEEIARVLSEKLNNVPTSGIPNRRAKSIRHPGEVGTVFDRDQVVASNTAAQSRNQKRGENYRGEEGGAALAQDKGNLWKKNHSFDASLGDILGKRLLGRLSDLNLTEWRTQLQDKFARVRNTEQAKGNTDSALSAYQAESLYYGRTGYRLENLREHSIDPIIREMKGRDIDLEEMDKFLYARHAVERNHKIGAMYPPGHPFHDAMTNPDIVGGSGMSKKQAQDILNARSNRIGDYKAVAAKIDAMNANTRRVLFDAGLISKDTFDSLNTTYKWYVPLRGWAEGTEDETAMGRQGSGMDVRGEEFKQAFGRKSLAASPLAYSMMQAEMAIVRAEKNKVARTFLRFVRNNPDPKLWTVQRPEQVKRVNKTTGLVTTVGNGLSYMADNAFAAKVNGETRYILLHGPDGLNVARALKNMGTANVHSVIRLIANLTHTMAKLATSWNPNFMIPNLSRDLGEAFINLQAQDQAKFVRTFASHIIPAIRGSMAAIAGKTAAPGSKQQKYIDAFHRYDSEGGRIHFFGIDDPDKIEGNINSRLKRLDGGLINGVKDMGEKASKAFEIMGGGIENATRLSAFMAAEDVGMSTPDAAMLARNLTVDFNKKGELGSAISSLYMFSNAGIQGTARMARSLGSKRVLGAVGVLAAMSALATLYDIGAGGEDEAGTPTYMKIPPWERDNNIIVMLRNGAYAKIPLPYGFAPFAVMGSRAVATLMGKAKPGESMMAVVNAITNAFNPLGEEGNVTMSLVPSFLRPAFHIAFNKDWTGKPLYPDNEQSKGRPDSTQAFKSTSEPSKFAAKKLNEATGGDNYKSGWADLHPATFDHLVGAVTGGTGKFGKDIIDTVTKGVMDHEWAPEKTPIIRRFYGKVGPEADQYAYYAARDEEKKREGALAQAKADRKAGTNTESAQKFIEEQSAQNRQKFIFSHADKQMKRLRAEEERITNSDAPYTEKKLGIDDVRQRMRDVQNHARAESIKLKEGRELSSQPVPNHKPVQRLYVSPHHPDT